MFYIQSGLPFTIAIPQMGFFLNLFSFNPNYVKKNFFIRTNV